MVQQIKDKTKIEVAKPYAKPFLDNNAMEQNSISTDASKLKSVQEAIPLDTIALLSLSYLRLVYHNKQYCRPQYSC